MHFQHLVEINDPLNPLLDTLTRDQLWRGLVLRAEAPKDFVPWLDDCELLERDGRTLSRMLRYGTLTVRDEVTFTPQETVRYDVPAQKDIAASNLVMTIEEPQPTRLFVRFEYADEGSEAETMDAFYNEFRCSAYREADIDTIRLIREMAARGELDAPI